MHKIINNDDDEEAVFHRFLIRRRNNPFIWTRTQFTSRDILLINFFHEAAYFAQQMNFTVPRT